MILYPNAKINLGLYITDKRDDGFHNLASIFYPVRIHDILEVNPSDKLSFESTGIQIPGSESDNLCIKAYRLLAQDYDIPPVTIHLHKQIPIGAGLGGGSSDAAYMLRAINQLFELNIEEKSLEEYARTLGSDCAFFIQNKVKYCYGKGDQFKDIQLNLSEYHVLIVNPNIHISTKEAYQGLSPEKISFNLEEKIKISQPNLWKGFLKNDFEESILSNHPIISDIKNQLYEAGCVYASMSGSGSSVFGIFKNKKKINTLDQYWVQWLKA